VEWRFPLVCTKPISANRFVLKHRALNTTGVFTPSVREQSFEIETLFATEGSEMSVKRHLDKFDSCENLSSALSSKFARTWCASLRTRPLRAVVA
jgi:hypothetical protein